SKDMGFAVPFTTFDSEDFQPDNPLTKSALKLESDGLTPIHGAYIPGQAWADGVANALLEYAQGTGDWNGVKKAYLDDWTSAWNDYENNFGMLPPAHK
ncbi:MAG: carbohydrate ABC transporter substrate-binding protein, partial [Bifidobacterium pseudocatenulatum]